MTVKSAVLIAAAGMVLSAVPVWAHHAFASEFDIGKPVVLEGVVTEVEMINPHAWIHIDVKNPDGTVTNWMVESGSPNVLMRRGFTKHTVEPGTKVTVDGFQAKDGSHRCNGKDIKLPNGQRLLISSQGNGAPEDDKK